jgi:hypothetical protein
MCQQAGLGRPHVRRRDDERGIGAQRGGATGGGDRLGGIRQPGAGQHRDAPVDLRDRGGEQGVVFDFIERGGFAGGPRHHHRVGAGIELTGQQPRPRVEVEGAGRRERRGQRGDAAGQLQGRARRGIATGVAAGDGNAGRP